MSAYILYTTHSASKCWVKCKVHYTIYKALIGQEPPALTTVSDPPCQRSHGLGCKELGTRCSQQHALFSPSLAPERYLSLSMAMFRNCCKAHHCPASVLTVFTGIPFIACLLARCFHHPFCSVLQKVLGGFLPPPATHSINHVKCTQVFWWLKS